MVTRNNSRRQATKEKKYGAEPRTTYKIEVRFNSDPSIKSISPVTKWGDSTEIALELLCPGTQEQGYRFFSPTIYQQKCYNYCRKQVHMKHKNWGTSKEFRIALNGPTQVEVKLPPIGSKKTTTVEERTISVGELEGVEVKYTRQ